MYIELSRVRILAAGVPGEDCPFVGFGFPVHMSLRGSFFPQVPGRSATPSLSYPYS